MILNVLGQSPSAATASAAAAAALFNQLILVSGQSSPQSFIYAGQGVRKLVLSVGKTPIKVVFDCWLLLLVSTSGHVIFQMSLRRGGFWPLGVIVASTTSGGLLKNLKMEIVKIYIATN